MRDLPIATIVLAALAVIVAVVGGIIVVLGPQHGADGLTFNEYVDALSKFAIGVGLLGVGRGLHTRHRP